MYDLIGCNVGPYRVVSRLGEGGMATVYKAYHPAMDRYVAMKVPSPRLSRDAFFRARFQREAQTLARLEHPHILPVYDIGEDGDVVYYVMRCVEGGTLRETFQNGPLPVSQAIRLVSEVADALAVAHQNGVIHGDIKPSNVLIGPMGSALLTDFGFARLFAESLPPTASTSGLGSPDYMAPEQIMGMNVDERTDIYALAVILFEAITGRRPIVGDPPAEVSSSHATVAGSTEPPGPPTLPGRVERVVLKATARDPLDRYQTAAAFAAALGHAVSAPTAPTMSLGGVVAALSTLRIHPSPAAAARARAIAHAAVTGRGPNAIAMGLGLVVVLIAILFRGYSGPAAAVAQPVTLTYSEPSPTARPRELTFTGSESAASVLTVAPSLQTAPAPAIASQPTLTVPAEIRSTATIDGSAALLPTVTVDVGATAEAASSPTAAPTITPPATEADSQLSPTPDIVPSQTVVLGTSVRRSPTARPSSTATARPSATPQPSSVAPVVVGSTSSAGAIVLSWTYPGQLGVDDYFDVRVWQDGQPATGIANVQQTSYAIGGSFPSGTYNWTIGVIRKQGGIITTLSQANQTLQFTWLPPADSGGPRPPTR